MVAARRRDHRAWRAARPPWLESRALSISASGGPRWNGWECPRSVAMWRRSQCGEDRRAGEGVNISGRRDASRHRNARGAKRESGRDAHHRDRPRSSAHRCDKKRPGLRAVRCAGFQPVSPMKLANRGGSAQAGRAVNSLMPGRPEREVLRCAQPAATCRAAPSFANTLSRPDAAASRRRPLFEDDPSRGHQDAPDLSGREPCADRRHILLPARALAIPVSSPGAGDACSDFAGSEATVAARTHDRHARSPGPVVCGVGAPCRCACAGRAKARRTGGAVAS